MIKFLIIVIIILLPHCSFDNKTGIWKNNNTADFKKEDKFKDFKTLYSKKKTFDKIIMPSNDLKINLSSTKSNLKWLDEYYQNSNNFENFSYKNQNKVIFKSKKLSTKKTQERLVFDGDKALVADEKGNIVVYSFSSKEITFKYNFYKKQFRNIKKNLNIIISDGIIYVGDNLGYLYALNYINGKLLWAKYFQIPFKSNLKIIDDTIVLADANNSLYFINKSNGDKLKIIPTEENIIQNDFISSLAINENFLFYLNTYGSLYSIDRNQKINWFVNLNQSLDLNPNNLFYSNPLVIFKDKVIVSTAEYLYVLNIETGATISKTSISSIIKPQISKKTLFLITKDNLLVCLNVDSGEIIYSVDINQEIASFLKIKKKSITVKSFAIVNNNLFVFLRNSYLVKFSKKAKIQNINKLPINLGSFPIFINDSIIYLDQKNKLVVLD